MNANQYTSNTRCTHSARFLVNDCDAYVNASVLTRVVCVSGRELDEYMWNNQDFLIVTSVGNKWDETAAVNYVAPPATAKNVVSVGGTHNGQDNEDNLLSTSNRCE